MNTLLCNRPAINARRGLMIALLGLLMLVYPPLSGLDGMDGGFALQTIGGFIIIVGLVTWAMYRQLAKRFSRILSGEEILAHWFYAPHEWQAYTGAEFAARREQFRALLFMILTIAAVVCLTLAIVLEDSAMIMLAVWIGLAVILGITQFIASHQNLWRNHNARGEAIVSQLGVLLPAEEHFWGVLGARIKTASITENPAALIVQYQAPTCYGDEDYVVHVPVPQGEIESAQRVAAALNAVADQTSKRKRKSLNRNPTQSFSELLDK